MERQAALEMFQNLARAGATGYTNFDPDKMGVVITINGNPYFNDSQLLYWCDTGGCTYTTDPGTPETLYGRRGVGYVAFNLNLIKSTMKEKDRKAKSFSFKITAPPYPTTKVLELVLGAYSSPGLLGQKNWDVYTDAPLNVEQYRMFKPAGLTKSEIKGPTSVIKDGLNLDVKVTFQTTDPKTKVVTPPKVEIFNWPDGGGDVG